MKIIRTTDRIKLTIEDAVFYLAPLTYDQRAEVGAQYRREGGTEVKDYQDMIKIGKLYLKYALKDVEGIETLEGEKYKLKFENNLLSDESVNDLMNIPVSKTLNDIAQTMFVQIPNEILDSEGNKLDGVEIEFIGESLKK